MKQRPLLLFMLLILSALALTILGYSSHVPLSRMMAAILDPAPDSLGETYLRYALLPRIFVALFAGAALSLSGVVFQQVRKNPLAEPSTLGLLSGAQLAVTLAAVAAPGMAAGSIELSAVTGALATLGLVMLLASKGGFSPSPCSLPG